MINLPINHGKGCDALDARQAHGTLLHGVRGIVNNRQLKVLEFNELGSIVLSD